MTDPTLAKICRQLSLVVITGVIIRRQAGPGLTLIILLSTTSSVHFIKLPSLNSFTEEEVKVLRRGAQIPSQVTKQMNALYLAKRLSIVR